VIRIRHASRDMKPERDNLSSDVVAGLTFAVVNVPQAMAHAVLATVNPVLGIFTLMVAVPVGALFTGSVYMNVSSTSALAVAAASGLGEVAVAQRVQALAALVLLVGIIQLLAGLFRLGTLVRFVSNSVMTGFLNGVAVLIILGQLNELTGFRSEFSNNVVRTLDLLLHPGAIDIQTTAIGLTTIALIVVFLSSRWQRYAFILAIAISTILLVLLALAAGGGVQGWDAVRTVGDIAGIPRSLPGLALPAPELLVKMLLPAFAVAIIGLIQGAGVSQAYPNPDGKYPDMSRDFLGQGAANIATSLVGGIPAGGSISGTVLITNAGARSRWTNVFAGLFVAVIVLLAAPLVELVPLPSLAALLIVAGVQGLRIPQAVTIWQTGRVSTVVMVITFVATLFLPLQYAVLIGVALSILLHVIRQSNKVLVTQWVLQERGWPLEQPAPRRLPSHQLTLLHVYGSLFFAAAKGMEEMLPDVDGATNAVVAILLRGQGEIGSTFVTVLERYARALQAHQSQLMLVGVDPATRGQLAKTGLLALIGDEFVFAATPQLGDAMNQAIAAAQAWIEGPPPPQASAPPPAPAPAAPRRGIRRRTGAALRRIPRKSPGEKE
jgi:sulfate permease, SulP family